MLRRCHLLGLLLAACSQQAAEQPSWLVIELVPALGVVEPPLNVQIQIAPADREPFALCVGVAGDPGQLTASLLLERARDGDAAAPVGLQITPFRELNGELGPGQQFTCPPELPPALGPPQVLEVRFCAGQTRRVVFHIGANCGCGGSGGAGGAGGSGGAGGAAASCCAPDQLCGAGIDTTGSICGENDCCKGSIGDACIELDAP